MVDRLALPGEMAGADDTDVLTIDTGNDALSGNVANVAGLRDSQAAILCLGYDTVGDRMFGLALGCGCEREFLVLAAAGEQYNVTDSKTTLCQRASFVEDDCVEVTRPLERRTVADQKRKLYFFESALTPNTFWVDLKAIDFSAETGKVKRLDLGPNQTNVFAGDTSKEFKVAEPFKFLGL